MGFSGLKQLLCLLLAVFTLAASVHHSLCDAGFISCPVCQNFFNGETGHEECPACAASQLLAKASEARIKFIMPAALPLTVFNVSVELPLCKAVNVERRLHIQDFIDPQKTQYLCDLVHGIPIRGPSMTA